MLYVGATLMIGASIYGFVDYKQTHQKKAFLDMYKEEKKAIAPSPAEEKTVAVEEKTSSPVTSEKKINSNRKKAETKEEVLPAIEPVSEADKAAATANEIAATDTERPEPASENKVVKKKKIRKEFFSRGRMPEEEVLIERTKKEPGKTASKD